MIKFQTLSFGGVTIYRGIDLHKKNWRVNIRTFDRELGNRAYFLKPLISRPTLLAASNFSLNTPALSGFPGNFFCSTIAAAFCFVFNVVSIKFVDFIVLKIQY